MGSGDGILDFLGQVQHLWEFRSLTRARGRGLCCEILEGVVANQAPPD